MCRAKQLTVKVKGDGGVGLAEFVLSGDLVLSSVLDRHVLDLQTRKVRVAVFVDGQLCTRSFVS